MSAIYVETSVLLALRASIFFSCRRYLLHRLYSNLEDLSTEANAKSTDPLPSPIALRTPLDKSKASRSSVYPTVSTSIFAGCFSESCLLFVLLLLQGANVFSSRTRLVNWQLSLFALLLFILVIIPFVSSFILAPRVKAAAPRIIFSSITVFATLALLSFVPLPEPSQHGDDLATRTLSRLVVLGILILGLLAGFGAVSNSWAYIPSRTAVVSTPREHDVASAEFALLSVREDLERKREEARRKADSQNETWMTRVMPSFRGDEQAQELKGLEALEYQMSRSLDDLRQRRAAVKYAGTVRGRIMDVVGRFFALYCLVRYIICFFNILLPPKPQTASSLPDVVTDTIAAFLGRVSGPDSHVNVAEIALITRHLSLVLVGVIILSSIQLVLRWVTRALRVTSKNLAAALMLLLLAQLMSVYLLSTIVQLRASFPPTQTTKDDSVNLFSTIPDFQPFGKLFDSAFLVSATGSLVVRWAAQRMNGPGV